MTNRLSRTACYAGAAAISIVIGGVIAPTSASAVTTLPALSDGQGNPVCFEDPRIVALGDVGTNYAGAAGCVSVRTVGSTLRLELVTFMPDWTYINKGGGGTNSRIQLQFTNSVTKARVDFRYEFGKTKVG